MVFPVRGFFRLPPAFALPRLHLSSRVFAHTHTRDAQTCDTRQPAIRPRRGLCALLALCRGEAGAGWSGAGDPGSWNPGPKECENNTAVRKYRPLSWPQARGDRKLERQTQDLPLIRRRWGAVRGPDAQWRCLAAPSRGAWPSPQSGLLQHFERGLLSREGEASEPPI